MVARLARLQEGFILAAVLWVLAIMLIAVGIFHSYVQRKLSIGIQAKAHIQQGLNNYSTEQTLLYVLSTSRKTLAGVTFSTLTSEQVQNENFSYTSAVGDELLLDGSVYRGIGDSKFSLQDSAGLISVNAEDQSILLDFFNHFETDAGVKMRLLAALHDYIDADEVVSLSGAEKQDYMAAAMPPPPNDYLRTPSELFRVMGWREWLNAHAQFDVQNWITVSRFTVMNLNTMPKSLLRSYLGLNEDLVDQLIVERRTNPFRTTDDFVSRAKLPLSLDEERFRFLPGNELRLRIWNSGGGQARLISLQLTPNGLLGPWLVDYEYSVQSVENNNEALAIRQSTLFDHALDDDIRRH